MPLGIAVGVGEGTAVGLVVGTGVGSEMRVGAGASNSAGPLAATVVGLGVATVVGETSAVAACAEGPLEVGDGRDDRDSGVGVAGKSGVAQPAAKAKLNPMKLAAYILRKLFP